MSASEEAAMRRMSAEEARERFGELLKDVETGPVAIEEGGQPVAVLYSMPWHKAAEEAKLDWLRRAIAAAKGGDESLDVPFDDALTEQLLAEIPEDEPARG